MNDKRIGYLGIGQMGAGIAWNLIEKGFDVTVCDIRSEAMAPFAEKNIKTTSSIKELVESVDHIYVCVVDDKGLINVVKGPNGILEYTRPGQVIIIQTTCMIETAKEIAADAAEKGVGVLDAPVSGNMEDRYNGTLAVYVGGDERFFEECRPALNAMGSDGEKVVYLGAVGNGSLSKLINNLIGLPVHDVVKSMMTLADSYGLPEETVLDILKIGTGWCWSVLTWPYMDVVVNTHRFGPGMARLGKKDLLDAQAAALAKGVGLPVTDIAIIGNESVQCERAALYKRKVGSLDYSVEQVTIPPSYKTN